MCTNVHVSTFYSTHNLLSKLTAKSSFGRSVDQDAASVEYLHRLSSLMLLRLSSLVASE